MTEPSVDRERVELVFGLTGGELETDPWDMPFLYPTVDYVPGIGTIETQETRTFHTTYWYEGIPEYAEWNDDRYEYRTMVRDCMFGMPPKRSTNGWERIHAYSLSGETECYCDSEQRGDCPLCEGDGFVYIGDGWHEVIYRRRLPF